VTLTRFYILHFILPFVLLFLVGIHIAILHAVGGSSTPTGTKRGEVQIPFHPYYSSKDLLAFIIFLIPFTYIIFFKPNLFSEPDNFIKANPLVTPNHIVPE
jgi:quinol-cytochrome oxidoreductase complex cytochrome b subunit